MKTRCIVPFLLTKQAIGRAFAGLMSALLLAGLDIGRAAQPSSEQIPLKLSGPPVTSPRPAWNSEVRQVKVAKIPVIDVTDLYHPCQDIGDNFDLITAYALPEIDLRAVILDCTDEWRSGSRLDPGFIPVTQLNYLFNRNVPCATIPWRRMKTLDDTMLEAPAFQQAGVELILRVLRESKKPVHVLSFGSARAIAVAFNRDPDLCRKKIKLIYLSAGMSNYDQDFEHNVKLDRLAIVRLLRSDLPIAVYPCGADNADSIGYGVKLAPFSYCPNNSYWKMPNSDFINQMDPRLCRYLVFAFQREGRADFLRAMDEKKTGDFKGVHYVWETGVWIQVSGRRLVQHADGTCRIIPAGKVVASDRVLPNDLRPCTVKVRDDGMFYWQPAERADTKKWIYYRGDAVENEKALQDALPALYTSFNPDAQTAPTGAPVESARSSSASSVKSP